MIHRFVDLLEELEPDIVFITREASPFDFFSVWKAGNLATPTPFTTSRITAIAADYIADSELSPDGQTVIYCRVGYNLTPRKQAIRSVDWDDTTNVELYSETHSTQNLSLQPSWSPDGTTIVFRSKGAGAALNLIKTMDADGSNVQTIYTGAAQVSNPLYSYDGSRIAFVEGGTVAKAMDADGSNVNTVLAPAGSPNMNHTVAWQRNALVLAVRYNDSAAFSSTERWYKVNDDGTGATQLHSVNRSSGYGPGDGDPGLIKWSWAADDSGIFTTIHAPAAAVPNHTLGKIMADGSGFVAVSPTRLLNSSADDARPSVIGTRVYYPDANPTFTQLSSIKPDGSDYRTDFQGTAISPTVTFHGFKGDTLNV